MSALLCYKYIAGVGMWLVSYIYINLIKVLNTAWGEWETQHITHLKKPFYISIQLLTTKSEL